MKCSKKELDMKRINILNMNNIASEIKNSIDVIYSRLDRGKEELANLESNK